MDKGHQQDEPIQPDDDDQGNTSERNVPFSSQLSYSVSISTIVSMDPASDAKKKGFIVYDSY